MSERTLSSWIVYWPPRQSKYSFHAHRKLSKVFARNKILSITPSETFHIEDGFELTPAERQEAEQLQKEEQMRRRDPKAHTIMMMERKERDLGSLRHFAPSHILPPAAYVHPTTSTQPGHWDAPMIATDDMLRPPSSAPGAMLNALSIVSPSVGVSPNLDQPDSALLPRLIVKLRHGGSVPAPKQTHFSLAAPQRTSGPPKFTTHDLQNHVDDSITHKSGERDSHLEEALGKAIETLLDEQPLGESPNNNGLAPKGFQKATRQEFRTIISMKCSENKYENIADQLQSQYARGLRNFALEKGKNEEQQRYLVSGINRMLDGESVHPEMLLRILNDKSRHAKPDTTTDVVVDGHNQSDKTTGGQPGQKEGQAKRLAQAAEQEPRHHVPKKGHTSGINGHTTERNGTINGSKENRGKRKSVADDQHASKRIKRTHHPVRNAPAVPAMEKTFENLLTRENARSSRGGS